MASDKGNNNVVQKSLIPSLHIHAVPIIRRSGMTFSCRTSISFSMVYHYICQWLLVWKCRYILDGLARPKPIEKKLVFLNFHSSSWQNPLWVGLLKPRVGSKSLLGAFNLHLIKSMNKQTLLLACHKFHIETLNYQKFTVETTAELWILSSIKHTS